MAKATTEEIELHKRILARDDVAFAILCEKYLEPTVKKVKSFHRQIHMYDDSLIMGVVIDSLYSYFYNPKKFDPDKQTLEKFLTMDAEGDLRNAWEKKKRQGKQIVTITDLTEVNDKNKEHEVKAECIDTPVQILINKESGDILRSELTWLFDSEDDIEIANLILSDERKTEAYAEILRITHLEFSAQQEEVKRNKDRVKKVLDRKLKGRNNKKL